MQIGLKIVTSEKQMTYKEITPITYFKKLFSVIKNSFLMRTFLFLLFLSTTIFSSKAQNIEAGLFLGTSFYNGDIEVAPKFLFQQIRPAYGVYGKYLFSPSIAVRAQFFHGTLFADEKKYPASAYRQSRGFSFESPINELSIQGEWHALNLDKGFSIDNGDPFMSFYVFGGAGGAFFNPITNYNEPNPIFDNVSIDRDTVVSTSTLSLLAGAGVQIKLSENWYLGGEFGMRKTFSDYLDKVSLLAGPRVKDYYFFSGLTIGYRFGGDSGLVGNSGRWNRSKNKTGCPTF
jgi:opacity protein-like surface antigen